MTGRQLQMPQPGDTNRTPATGAGGGSIGLALAVAIVLIFDVTDVEAALLGAGIMALGAKIAPYLRYYLPPKAKE